MVGNTEKTATERFHEALERLLVVANGSTGQSSRVANFLLAWWNSRTCGGFDLTDFWAVDADLARDMLVVLNGMAQLRQYPDAMGYGARFQQLVRDWRPHLVDQQEAS